jgi:hypothetical protein
MLCREKPRDESRKTIVAQVGRFHNFKVDPKTRHLVELRQLPIAHLPYDRLATSDAAVVHAATGR